MTSLPLTRACTLADFDGCHSVGRWQNCHADDAVARWQHDVDVFGGRSTTVNWGSWPFSAPPQPIGGPRDYYDNTESMILVCGDTAVIYALSVLDRIPEPKAFLRQVHLALVPGGLFYATFAIWGADGPDVAIGAGLRTRIYDRLRWKRLIEEVRDLGFRTFGGVDLRYPGDTLHDHSLGTLVCVKEDR